MISDVPYDSGSLAGSRPTPVIEPVTAPLSRSGRYSSGSSTPEMSGWGTSTTTPMGVTHARSPSTMPAYSRYESSLLMAENG